MYKGEKGGRGMVLLVSSIDGDASKAMELDDASQ